MALSGHDFHRLCEALQDAFPHGSSLHYLTRVALDRHLHQIPGWQDEAGVPAALVSWAEANEKLDALLDGATMLNPDNPRLKATIEALTARDTKTAGETPETASGIGPQRAPGAGTEPPASLRLLASNNNQRGDLFTRLSRWT